MAKRRKASPVSRTEVVRMRRELAHVKQIVERNADALEAVQKDCATNLRRCAELQRDLDHLRKLLARD